MDKERGESSFISKSIYRKNIWHFLLGNQFAISKSTCFDIRPRTRVLELLVFRISYRLQITFPRGPNLMSHDIKYFLVKTRQFGAFFIIILAGYSAYAELVFAIFDAIFSLPYYSIFIQMRK